MSNFIKLLLVLLIPVTAVQSQDEPKISIAILPFVQSAASSVMNLNTLQETVTKEFVDRNRFEIVDRSKFQAVLKELNIQKSEEFLNSNVVEQGKLAGAQFLVTGVANEVRINKITDNIYNPVTKLKETVINYQGIIRLSYQVIDVATGLAAYNENITAYSRKYTILNEGEIMAYTLCMLRKNARIAIMKQFPSEIKILKVEKSDKKGLPQIVLVNAGESMFAEDAEGSCGTDGLSKAFDKINFLKRKDKVYLAVYDIEIMTVNGKDIKREKEIGKLELTDVQGEVSECEVKNGAKEILDEITGGKKMVIKIK